MTGLDRDLVAAIAARLDPVAFDHAIPWPTPPLLAVRRRCRLRALRQAARLIRLVRGAC
jgi:hypothetical protein